MALINLQTRSMQSDLIERFTGTNSALQIFTYWRYFISTSEQRERVG